MRVMCIKDPPWLDNISGTSNPGPNYGDTLHVLRIGYGICQPILGVEFYIFTEYTEYAYLTKHFIPLTGDTTEDLQELAELETVNH